MLQFGFRHLSLLPRCILRFIVTVVLGVEPVKPSYLVRRLFLFQQLSPDIHSLLLLLCIVKQITLVEASCARSMVVPAAHADPAEMVLAVDAFHVVAAAIFLHGYLAAGTWL